MASVVAVCVSETKGSVKTPVQKIFLKSGYGISGDAHAGQQHRQVSLLASESVELLREKIPTLSAGAFAENILTKGICLHTLPIGKKLIVGKALLSITQIGKKCHNDGCAIKRQSGDCVMPREGVFADVLKDGAVKPGDEIIIVDY